MEPIDKLLRVAFLKIISLPPLGSELFLIFALEKSLPSSVVVLNNVEVIWLKRKLVLVRFVLLKVPDKIVV